jgi:hypothetical protein
MTDQPLIQIEASPTFNRNLRNLTTSDGIILLTIYAKSEQVDIAPNDIQSIITEYEKITIVNHD